MTVTPLTHPADGIPPVIDTVNGLTAVFEELKMGSGPIAIDAERASGYKYSQRAYLIQIKRNGGGLHLIDPVAIGECDIWQAMSKEFAECEWIIHASTQDLACLREVGLEPQRLFDTELGGRIAGCERVGLGALTEELLGRSLAKEHSAVDWSIRPLKEDWLNYAALDVEVLIELRDAVEQLLLGQGKLNWALQDFDAILKAPAPAPRVDPWRRTSGMHKVRDRRTLAIVKALWNARDTFAREIDISPGRLFNDELLMQIATKRPAGVGDMRKWITRRSRVTNQPIEQWFDLMNEAIALPEDQLPELRIKSEALPPPKSWDKRNPPAYARHTHARHLVAGVADDLAMPVENLISPEPLRRLCWLEPPTDHSEIAAFIDRTLSSYGVRPWQVAQTSDMLAVALYETEPLIIEVPEESASGESEGADV
jgi:ribonuclease D